MKLRIGYAQLEAVTNFAESKGLRKGQHVYNVFFANTALEDSSRLFYCDDSEFWKVIQEFATIV